MLVHLHAFYYYYLFCHKKVAGSEAMVLSQLKEGQSARILQVNGQGLFRKRILEMGLVKGAELYVEKYAPLKDPLEILVKGYHVSLRVEEAELIKVELIGKNG